MTHTGICRAESARILRNSDASARTSWPFHFVHVPVEGAPLRRERLDAHRVVDADRRAE
jgi:hypothetical protein